MLAVGVYDSDFSFYCDCDMSYDEIKASGLFWSGSFCGKANTQKVGVTHSFRLACAISVTAYVSGTQRYQVLLTTGDADRVPKFSSPK